MLCAAWLLAWPVPLVLMLAQHSTAVILVHVRLGVQQTLTWSITVNMMVDAADSARRGTATGLNALAEYLRMSVVAFLTGQMATPYGLRRYL